MQSDYSITVPQISADRILDAAFKATKRQIKEQLAEVERSPLDRVTNFFLRRDTKATEKKRNKIKRFFPILFWNETQPELEELYKEAKTKLSNQNDAMINKLCDAYKREFDRKFMKEKQYMEDIKKEKKENDELNNKILCLKEQRKEINDNISKCIRVGSQL